MSDELVKRARRTALWEGHGEQSDLAEQMADRIEELERQYAHLRSAIPAGWLEHYDATKDKR